MNSSFDSENERRELESQKFVKLGEAVRVYIAKFGSPAARKSGHIQRLAYDDPTNAIEHIQKGANLPEDLTYESQLRLARSFLETIFDEPFDVDALLAEGMPSDNREPLSAETQGLLDKYISLSQRLERILCARRLASIPDQSSRILFLRYAIEKAIDDIYDREPIQHRYNIDTLTEMLGQIESELS